VVEHGLHGRREGSELSSSLLAQALRFTLVEVTGAGELVRRGHQCSCGLEEEVCVRDELTPSTGARTAREGEAVEVQAVLEELSLEPHEVEDVRAQGPQGRDQVRADVEREGLGVLEELLEVRQALPQGGTRGAPAGLPAPVVLHEGQRDATQHARETTDEGERPDEQAGIGERHDAPEEHSDTCNDAPEGAGEHVALLEARGVDRLSAR
jgi:hypothetical protein